MGGLASEEAGTLSPSVESKEEGCIAAEGDTTNIP